MTSLMGVGLVVPVLVVLDLVLVVLEGQDVALEGLAAQLAQQGVGQWRQLQCRWSSFCHGCLYMFTDLVPVTLITVCLKNLFPFLLIYKVSLL